MHQVQPGLGDILDFACAGRVAINGMLDDQEAPFGGFRHSGVGREFGTFGIEAFLEPRAILE
jgi:aldehyde dehydrogenase (NAD+)